MNPASSSKWNREILHLTRFRIEPRDFVCQTKIGYPQKTTFIRSGAEGHAARPRHVVLDVYNVHGLAAERPHRFRIPRHVRRRFWQHRIRTEQTIQISRHLFRILIAKIRTKRDAEMHGLPHERDAVFPAVQVTPDGSHAALKLMADV